MNNLAGVMNVSNIHIVKVFLAYKENISFLWIIPLNYAYFVIVLQHFYNSFNWNVYYCSYHYVEL